MLKRPLRFIATIGLAATVARCTGDHLNLNPLNLSCNQRGLAGWERGGLSSGEVELLFRVNVETLIYNFFYNPDFRGFDAIRLSDNTSSTPQIITREDNPQDVVSYFVDELGANSFLHLTLMRGGNEAMLSGQDDIEGLQQYFPNEIATSLPEYLAIAAGQSYIYRYGEWKADTYIIFPFGSQNLVIRDPKIVSSSSDSITVVDEIGNEMLFRRQAATYVSQQIAYLDPSYNSDLSCTEQ